MVEDWNQDDLYTKENLRESVEVLVFTQADPVKNCVNTV